MPNITISVTTAQWDRLRPIIARDLDLEGLPTSNDVVRWLLGLAKERVQQHEWQKASVESRTQKKAEMAAEGW